MIAGLLSVGWLVLTVIDGLIARKVGNTERGWGNFNGLSLGVLVIRVMLSLHLLYVPRHQTGTPFALDQITYLTIVARLWFVMTDLFRMGLRRLARTERKFGLTAAGIAIISLFIVVGFVIRSIIEKQGASLGEVGETPAEVLTVVMVMSLLIGFVLMFLLDLPREFWLRAKAPVEEAVPEPVRRTAKENRRVAVPTSTVGARMEIPDKKRTEHSAVTTIIRN